MLSSSRAEIRDCVTPLTLPPLLPMALCWEGGAVPRAPICPRAACRVQTAQEHEVWMGGGGGVVVGNWNSDSLTYQGWKFQAYLSPVPGGPWELGEVGIGGMRRKIMRK